MNEMKRTLIFVVVACGAVAAATVAHVASKPTPLAGFEDLGTEFYPDFKDSNEAKSLKVVAYDEDTATVREFEVHFKDGIWTIPSRHDYPADAKDRLANTAASVIGITRGAQVGRRESDFERFGVIDPLTDDSTQLKGRGQRVTLAKENGTVLADYIIGKQVEKPAGHYYVRQPKDKKTFITKLDINLSTKFADWIEPDLLKLERDELVEIIVNKYSIDEQQFRIVDREVSELTRKTLSDPWKLAGLDEKTEELKTDEISGLVNNLDDLKIVGVRPKPRGLNPDLSLQPAIAKNPLMRNALARDLANKGFLLVEDQNGNPHLVSNEGEVTASTNEGVQYVLHFGEIFTGTELEIEYGSTDEDEDAAEPDAASKKTGEKEVKGDDKKTGEDAADEEGKSESAVDDDSKDDDDGDGDLKRSRYLFVIARLDPEAIGPAPKKPKEPQKPQATIDDTKKKASDSDSEKKKAGDSKKDSADDKLGSGTKEDDKKKDETVSADEKDSEKGNGKDESGENGDQPQEKPVPYEEVKKKYDEDFKKYDDDLKQHEEKLKEGQEQVDELNERFAGWYYVISAESFENLRLSRAELIKPKEKPEDEEKKDGDKKKDSATETKPDGDKKPVSGPVDAQKPKSDNSADADKPGSKKKDAAKPAGKDK